LENESNQSVSRTTLLFTTAISHGISMLHVNELQQKSAVSLQLIVSSDSSLARTEIRTGKLNSNDLTTTYAVSAGDGECRQLQDKRALTSV